MRRSLSTILRSGEALSLTPTTTESLTYQHITVLGGSGDSVRFSLNGLDVTLPAGFTGVFVIDSLSVTAVFAAAGGPGSSNCGLLVQGFAQKNSIFGSN